MNTADATLDRNGLEVLSYEECVSLLARAPVGRLGVSSDALPVVLPVNYVVDGDRIVVRTNPGTKLDAALRNAVVAFEVDHYDPVAHTGWSVLVTGRATVIDDQTDIAAVKRLPLRAWGAVPADRFVAISMDLVNGRRIPAGGPG